MWVFAIILVVAVVLLLTARHEQHVKSLNKAREDEKQKLLNTILRDENEDRRMHINNNTSELLHGLIVSIIKSHEVKLQKYRKLFLPHYKDHKHLDDDINQINDCVLALKPDRFLTDFEYRILTMEDYRQDRDLYRRLCIIYDVLHVKIEDRCLSVIPQRIQNALQELNSIK